jgi:predicted RND superfamily exporter protein
MTYSLCSLPHGKLLASTSKKNTEERLAIEGGVAMRPTTRRLVSVSVLILGVSIIGFVLGAIYYWPSQFVLDGSAGQNATAGNPIQGNVTSIPLPAMIVLAIFAFLASSRRWWGAVAVAVLCLLGVVFINGALGEIYTPPSPYVPGAVLVATSVVYSLLGLSLLLSGIADLVDRVRVRREPARVH